MTRIAWLLGNWLSQLQFAFRHGWRNGQGLRPNTMPKPFRPAASVDNSTAKS